MKADYVHKDTRTIVVDGVEIQTSLTAAEIASLKQENQKYKEVIDKATKELMNIPINASYSEIEEYSRKAYRTLKEVE